MPGTRMSMRKTREILRQKWVLRRSHREVASGLDVSIGAVTGTLHRAHGRGPCLAHSHVRPGRSRVARLH